MYTVQPFLEHISFSVFLCLLIRLVGAGDRCYMLEQDHAWVRAGELVKSALCEGHSGVACTAETEDFLAARMEDQSLQCLGKTLQMVL